MELEHAIRKILDDTFESNTDEMLDTRLEDLPLDSMELVSLIFEIEEAFDVTVDKFEDVDNTQTLRNFIDSYRSK